MEIRSPIAEGEDHLSALPAELLASVVEHLFVREICRFRSLSRHFCDFVDTNEGLLTQGLVRYHRARIGREYRLLTDLCDCDIVDALRRYDSHYGLVLSHQVSMSSFRKVEAVLLTLHFNWIKSHHFPAAAWHQDSSAWVEIYSIMSDPEVAESYAAHLDAAVDQYLRNHAWSLGFRDADAFLTKLRQVTSTRLDAAYVAIPSTFITQREMDTTYSDLFRTQKGLANRREKSEFEQLLGLPNLDSKEGSLAYCLSSGKTASLLRKMKEGRSAKLKQAAIIEEIFIW